VDVVIILVFVSLLLVTAAVAMFIMRVQGGDFEHGERLSLLPLDDDDPPLHRAPEDGAASGPSSGGER
jgi:hypothetical protein